jgi:hypothetical protein
VRHAVALLALAGAFMAPTGAQGFAFKAGEAGFAVSAVDEGAAATLAGSHPHSLTYRLAFNEGDLRDLHIQMPPGLLENSTVLPLCRGFEFQAQRTSPYEASLSGEDCRAPSQIGVVRVERAGGEARSFGLFNLPPAEGAPAAIGFAPFGAHVTLNSAIGSVGGEYALSLSAAGIAQSLHLSALTLTIWGVPWNASHDDQRGDCLNESEPAFGWAKCSTGPPANAYPFAYLTLPTSCAGALFFTATASSWSGAQVSASALNRDAQDKPAIQQGCNTLVFDPRPEAFLTDKKASSASGYNFRLKVNYEGILLTRLRAPSQTKGATVTLPPGVTVNPSVGAGLETCTPAQYETETDHWSSESGCPSTAKIGDFRLHSPLYAEWIDGGIYLAQPHENPFGSLIAVYLIAKSPERGILVKLAGEVDPDPGTGNLTASFPELPQLPYTDLEVNFRSGQRAPLITPNACGQATSQVSLSPWSVGLKGISEATHSEIETGIEAGPCPTGATPPFAPGATAGGVNSNVGSYTPYYVHLTRKDTEQEITSYSLVLPKGITGKLAGVPFCSEAAIAAARQNSGFAETERPSCPEASLVGHTYTGYGVGHALTYAPGRIYLAGPYGGQPLSLVTINSATVGPFDLGTIVIRSAFHVDPLTAQLRIDAGSSDPIPHIIDGIPLHLREIRIYVDRPEFTHNPTSCEPGQMESTLTGSGASFEDQADDSSATVGVHFQLLNCLTLGYAPHLGLKIAGGTRRGDYPSLQAVMQAHKGDADLKQIAVTMPHSEFLAQEHIRTVCTQAQFAAEACPEGSVYGTAAAFTPLFDEPLRGPVYLRSSEHKLPDLVALLRSGEIRIVLDGRIDSAHGGMRASFFDLPDAPLYRFVMKLYGGKRGLITNSVNICADPPVATVKAVAQNNRGAAFRSLLHSPRCQQRAKQDKRQRGRQRRSR